MTQFIHRPVLLNALDRLGVRPLLQRVGAVAETGRELSNDADQVNKLLAADWFNEGLSELAAQLDREYPTVRAEAVDYLREMSARHHERAGAAWLRFSRWILRAYDVLVDEKDWARLRELDRHHALVLLPSHRSYLDAWVYPAVMAAHGISPQVSMGGANLNFFPFGTIASRSGMVFIRRSTRDLPVYRYALRSYIGQLIRDRENLGWSIEGGRTRTGKLRPPVYGILRYVADAVQAADGPEVMVVPISIVYDQLHEVSLMTSEARGGAKRPEDIRWLANFARSQRQRLGRAYLDIGDPIPLRARLTELSVDPAGRSTSVERLALDVCHRINRATPVTPTAVVCLALLGAEGALTLDEVLAAVAPLARYIAARKWPVAGAAPLIDRSTIRRTLQEMVASGVLAPYDGGTDPVWRICADRHLVAAFYRNTAIHMLVGRAICELALLAAAEADDGDDGDGEEIAWAEALRIRDLLKFEFFFSGRKQFAADMQAEMALIDPGAGEAGAIGPSDARQWLDRAHPLLAHLVLRPFLEAYLVVADRLVARDSAAGVEFDEGAFLDECLRVGRQWTYQRRLASEESVSLELFKTALRLARHRDLVESTASELGRRRREFAGELADTVRRVACLADRASVGALARTTRDEER